MPQRALAAVASPVAAACALFWGGAAFATDPGVCRENRADGRPIHMGKTERWQLHFTMREPELMEALAGRWYSEAHYDSGGRAVVSRQIQVLEVGGTFRFEAETCPDGGDGECATNRGGGLWAAMTQRDGSIYVARNLTDQSRENECVGFAVTIGADGRLIDAYTGEVLAERRR